MPCCPPPLSVSQAVAATGFSKSTILRDIAEETLSAHKLPGRTGVWLICHADLEEYLAARLVCCQKE